MKTPRQLEAGGGAKVSQLGRQCDLSGGVFLLPRPTYVSHGTQRLSEALLTGPKRSQLLGAGNPAQSTHLQRRGSSYRSQAQPSSKTASDGSDRPSSKNNPGQYVINQVYRGQVHGGCVVPNANELTFNQCRMMETMLS
jgi:hypothetical protein